MNNDLYGIYDQYHKKCRLIGEVSTITTDLTQAATAITAPFPPAPGISLKQSDQNFNSNIISSGKNKKELQRDVNNFKKLIDMTKGIKLDQDVADKIDQAKQLLVQYNLLYGIRPTN